MKPKSGVIITLEFKKAFDILRTASMIVMLVLTLEVDLGDAAVSSGDIY